MEVTETKLDGVLIIKPQVFRDDRGWFFESYTLEKLGTYGINTVFIQDNRARSNIRGTLRGLHFQKDPDAQSKLLHCTRGEVLDVAVDIRKGSPTYCEWVALVLSEENMLQVYIPAGFAHGYITLTDNAEVQYKVDKYYSPEHDRSIRYDDPVFGIDWTVRSPILSDKDKNAPFLKDSDNSFIW